MNEELMTPEQFTDLSKQIVDANGDQGAITAVLTQIQDGFSKLFASHGETCKHNEELTAENEKLKEYNLELFMRQGQKMVEETKQEKETKQKTKARERAETITVEDLFKKEEK